MEEGRGQREMDGRLSGDISIRYEPCTRTLCFWLRRIHIAILLPTILLPLVLSTTITDLGCGPRDKLGIMASTTAASLTRPRAAREATVAVLFSTFPVQMLDNPTTMRTILSVMWSVFVPPPLEISLNRYVPRVRRLLMSVQYSVCFRTLRIHPPCNWCLGGVTFRDQCPT